MGKIIAYICAVSILAVVFILVLQKEPVSDPNIIVIVRIILSLAVAIIGAVIPGFLHVDLTWKGVSIRAFGALALFIISFFFTPKVLPISEISDIKKSSEETLDEIGRLSTKFESVFVQAVYELPLDKPAVKLLEEAILEIDKKISAKKIDIPQGLSYVYTQNVKTNISRKEVSIELNHALDRDIVVLSPNLIDIVPILNFLKAPSLQIGINRSTRDKKELTGSLMKLSDAPDLHLFAHHLPVQPDEGNFGKIIYVFEERKLLVAWNGFEFPADKWATSRKVMSIKDLDEAQIVVMISNKGSVVEAIDQVAFKMKPRWINFRFDNNFVTLTEFEPTKPVSQSMAFCSIFPAAEKILNGTASHGFQSARLWGF
ncbi:hypothetical protein [Vibrio parahaemolyticus]|uniref:hypothetical protein n=1 Tax=Vibrio parahaemolyticus TaxID=670 RepID=UPI00236073F4|nr:hypothetical protein [Vibrio parahaemolyticus]